MALNSSDIQLFRQALTQALRERWVLFLIEGLILVLLGVLAILVPMVAVITVATLIAWVILVSGAVGLIATFMAHNAPGFWWSLLSAIIDVVVGVMLLGGPERQWRAGSGRPPSRPLAGNPAHISWNSAASPRRWCSSGVMSGASPNLPVYAASWAPASAANCRRRCRGIST
jgi:Short repeat of unknown function (DUF308)